VLARVVFWFERGLGLGLVVRPIDLAVFQVEEVDLVNGGLLAVEGLFGIV